MLRDGFQRTSTRTSCHSPFEFKFTSSELIFEHTNYTNQHEKETYISFILLSLLILDPIQIK